MILRKRKKTQRSSYLKDFQKFGYTTLNALFLSGGLIYNSIVIASSPLETKYSKTFDTNTKGQVSVRTPDVDTIQDFLIA